MTIAALYDIHGNLPALNALLEELKEVRPDLIVVGGDIVSGPMPAQTLQRLFQLGDQVRAIGGNADREVVMAFDGQPLSPALPEEVREVAQWTAGQLTRSQRDFLAALPQQLVLQVEGLGRVLFCHATVRSDEELFTAITPQERLRVIFSHVEQQTVVCGHTHMQFERHVGDLRLCTSWKAPEKGRVECISTQYHVSCYNMQSTGQELHDLIAAPMTCSESSIAKKTEHGHSVS